MDNQLLDKMQSALQSVPFITLLDINVTSLDLTSSTLEMEMPFTNQISRMVSLNQMHGGAIAALIDSAATFLVVAHVEDAVPTINFRTDYLKPAGKSTLTAKAKMRRLGASVAVVDVDVVDEGGQLIAIGRGTFGTTGG